MNQVTFSEQAYSQVLTMSSRLIAELTGKRHSDVIRDIRQMLENMDDAILRHEEYQELKDNRGYTSEFLLNKNLSITLMTGYDVNARHKINMRWQELEQQTKHISLNLNDPYVLRRALLEYADRNIELETKNTGLERSIQTITQTNHGVKFQQACKILNIKRDVLAKWLRSHGWDRHLNDSGELYNYTQIDFFILPKGMDVLAKNFGGL